MTNTELLAKIKAEIERRKKSLRAGICNEEVFTRKQRKEMLVASEELDRFNRFLSDLEKSEKPMEQEDIDTEIGHWMDRLDDKYCLLVSHYSIQDIKDTARHFAKWGAEHLKK